MSQPEPAVVAHPPAESATLDTAEDVAVSALESARAPRPAPEAESVIRDVIAKPARRAAARPSRSRKAEAAVAESAEGVAQAKAPRAAARGEGETAQA
jgi:hypothetical protein